MNRSLTILVALLCVVYGFSQKDQSTDKIIEGLDRSARSHPNETIYLQTSKGIYETEEDLWFKAYVLNAQDLQPSIRSRILYLYLTEQNTGNIVWKEKYEIERGFVSGHVYLSDTLSMGNYQLEAYSSGSLTKHPGKSNDIRRIKILRNIKDKVSVGNSSDSSQIDFRLFPEGGKLVAGLSNKMAFRAVNTKGLPIEINGVLFENNVAIDTLKTVHAGMGFVQFSPNSSATYRIDLDHSGNDKSFKLPQIHDSGYSLTLLKQEKGFLLFEIQKTGKGIEEFYLRTQVRGTPYSLASGRIKNKAKVKVPLSEIPQGIAEITLYDGRMRPICERLTYVNDHKRLFIKTSINDLYQTREKVSLTIEVRDHLNNPIKAHLGLSIYDRVYDNQMDDKNILNHFYLSGSVKGSIFNPSYYFDESNIDRLSHLDLLLLTQGWRNYVWNDRDLIVNNNSIDLVSDTLQGKVLFTRKKKGVVTDQGVVMMYSPMNDEQKQLILIDSTGIFDLTPAHLKYAEKNYLYLKPITPPKSKYKASIQLNDPFNRVDSIRSLMTWDYPTNVYRTETEPEVIPYQYESGRIQLDEVTLTSNDPAVIRDKYLGRLDSILGLEVIDYIAEPCFTLNCPFHPYQPGNKLAVVGEVYERYVGESIVNGKREEIREKVLYTKPVITDEYILKRFNLTRVKSFYGKREFYQPVYDEMNIDDPFPDLRNTLLWAPELITDENGKAVIEFYCSDIHSKFIMKIEGVDGTGLLGQISNEFVVKKN